MRSKSTGRGRERAKARFDYSDEQPAGETVSVHCLEC